MEIYEKLRKIQTELKAPKGQYNSFGKYKYRSCEDILEAVKPLLAEQGMTMVIKDEIVAVNDRVYVKATATLIDGKDTVENTAYARESEKKSGMDDSQITGTASSYARKYCLNGLFLIDDTKDADTDEYRNVTNSKANSKANDGKVTAVHVASVREAIKNNPDKLSEQGVCNYFNIKSLEDMTMEQLNTFNSWRTKK